MENIQSIFLTKTIPSLLESNVEMDYVKFVFDKETLKGLKDYLNKEDMTSYYEGLKSIEYLYNVHKDSEEVKEGIYINVHDSEKFFNLLQELIETYAHSKNHTLVHPYNFIRSIWLRMGVSDVNDVEGFLERQLKFLKNDAILAHENSTIHSFNDDEYLSYQVKDNKDWFETNQNMYFKIYKLTDSIFDTKEYAFPSIHYGFSEENNIGECYIYGIQKLETKQDEEIKEKLQPIRSSLRNKNISPDFIIGMSLFLDFLYTHKITVVEIPTLQVFNYEYHEGLSNIVKKEIESYDEIQSSTPEYRMAKKLEERFADKEDIISYNKTERFVELFRILMELNPNIELVSEPFVTGENMVIHLNGTTDILKDYEKKERTK